MLHERATMLSYLILSYLTVKGLKENLGLQLVSSLWGSAAKRGCVLKLKPSAATQIKI